MAALLSWPDIDRRVASGELLLVIANKVYDATRFADSHPGGREVFSYFAAHDATDAHETFHPPSVEGVLSSLYIGDLDLSAPRPKNKEVVDDAFTRDMRSLLASLRREGLFTSSKLYYAWKMLSTMFIYIGSLYILMWGTSSTVAFWVSAILFGLSQQQFAYLSHDLVHHQVFKDRCVGDAFGYAFGTFCQSFAGCWWKWRHNLHHATCNTEGFDKDIDTMPILAWSTDLLPKDKKDYPAGSSILLPNQAYLFLPLLCLARINWVVQSFIVAVSRMFSMHKTDMSQPGVAEFWNAWYRWPAAELAGMTFHWAYLTVFALLCCHLSILDFVYWASVASGFAGFFLGSVFAISHNGMDVFTDVDGRLDFYRTQIRSSRNINSSWINDWYGGGLNYQVEHHLFPSLPRHRFGEVAPRVRALCEKHGERYVSVGFWEGFFDLFAVLARVGKQVKRDFAGKSGRSSRKTGKAGKGL